MYEMYLYLCNLKTWHVIPDGEVLDDHEEHDDHDEQDEEKMKNSDEVEGTALSHMPIWSFSGPTGFSLSSYNSPIRARQDRKWQRMKPCPPWSTTYSLINLSPSRMPEVRVLGVG